jgi:hypothetical protein
MKVIENKKVFNLFASGGLVHNPGIVFWGLLFLEGYNIGIGTMSIITICDKLSRIVVENDE